MNRNVAFRSFLFVWMSLVLSGSVRADDAEGTSPSPPLKIQKIYFMFHRVCWRNFGATPPSKADKKLWAACYNRELQVNEKQKQFISDLKPDEALVLFPIGRSGAMRELEDHATEALGRRCIIVRRNGWDPPAAWGTLPNAIDEFLNNPQLEGMAEFLSPVPVLALTEKDRRLAFPFSMAFDGTITGPLWSGRPTSRAT